jgi:hypothetical protein
MLGLGRAPSGQSLKPRQGGEMQSRVRDEDVDRGDVGLDDRRDPFLVGDVDGTGGR